MTSIGLHPFDYFEMGEFNGSSCVWGRRAGYGAAKRASDLALKCTRACKTQRVLPALALRRPAVLVHPPPTKPKERERRTVSFCKRPLGPRHNNPRAPTHYNHNLAPPVIKAFCLLARHARNFVVRVYKNKCGRGRIFRDSGAPGARACFMAGELQI
jgi:hypothetical protein